MYEVDSLCMVELKKMDIGLGCKELVWRCVTIGCVLVGGVGMFGIGALGREDCWFLDVGGNENVFKGDSWFSDAVEKKLWKEVLCLKERDVEVKKW